MASKHNLSTDNLYEQISESLLKLFVSRIIIFYVNVQGIQVSKKSNLQLQYPNFATALSVYNTSLTLDSSTSQRRTTAAIIPSPFPGADLVICETVNEPSS